MLSIKDRTYKTLILTDYGRHRVMQSLSDNEQKGFNITHLCFGSSYRTNYDTSITSMGPIVYTVELTPENKFQIDNTFFVQVELESSFDIREIGLFETVGPNRYLFAYLSGLELKKAPKSLSFKILVDVSLEISFKDFDFKDYNVELSDDIYAQEDDLGKMYNAASRMQIDLERCIQKNARLLGFNRANVYYNEQLKVNECLNSFLLLNRFSNTVKKFENDALTDYFVFPTISKHSYSLRNLVDPESTMSVVGNVLTANKDNIDFTRATSIMYTGTISSLNKTGTIIAKSDPKNDNCYFEFCISADDVADEKSERYLKFTAYSYDISLEQQLTVDTAKIDEPKIVGEYSIIYRVLQDSEVYKNLLNKECTFSFIFNGSEDNPKFDFYINDLLITSDENINKGLVSVSNFRFFRPPSFVDYEDEIRYDFISNEKEGDVIKVSANLPDFESNLYEDTYFEILSDEDIEHLKFLGVFDDLQRNNKKISNYDKNTGMVTPDDIQTTNNTPDMDFLRQHKIVGDITWRNYKIRYEFYKNMQKSCTLRNYTAFYKTEEISEKNVTHRYETPVYYTLESVKPASLLTFSKALTPDEVVYISNLSRS